MPPMRRTPRLVAPLTARLGQQIVIDNPPGAGGNIAAEISARSAPDGYTWFLGDNSARLYRYTPQQRAALADDFVAVAKANYDQYGDGRTNLRYGYMQKPAA